MPAAFRTPNGAAVGTAFASVYTCPADTTAIVLFCQVTNIDGASNVDIDVQWLDASNANAATLLASTMSIPADAAITPLGGKLVLQAGDALQMKASATGDAVATISVLELT